MTDFLRKLLGFVKPYRRRFIAGLVCGIFYGLTSGALLATVKIVTGLVFKGETNFHEQLEKAPHWVHPLTHALASWLPEFRAPASSNDWHWLVIIGAIPAVMLLRNTLAYLSVYLVTWSAMRAVADIRTKLFGHLQNLSLGFFSRASTGDLIARITNDTQILYGIIGGSFASLVKDPVTVVVIVGYLLALQPDLTLISVVVLPVCLVPIVIYGRKVRKSARAMQGYNAELTNLMHESFTGTRIVKAYNLEETVARSIQGNDAQICEPNDARHPLQRNSQPAHGIFRRRRHRAGVPLRPAFESRPAERPAAFDGRFHRVRAWHHDDLSARQGLHAPAQSISPGARRQPARV